MVSSCKHRDLIIVLALFGANRTQQWPVDSEGEKMEFEDGKVIMVRVEYLWKP